MNSIAIPLTNGTIDKVVLKLGVDTLEPETSESSTGRSGESELIKEHEIDIDYSKLSRSIENLEKDDLETHIQSIKNKEDSIRKELQSTRPDFKVLVLLDFLKLIILVQNQTVSEICLLHFSRRKT